MQSATLSRSPQILVGVVDDHDMLREGISCIVDIMPDANVAMSVPDVHAAVEYLQDNPLDVLLLDICLGGPCQTDGLEGIELLLDVAPDLKIVMFSHSDKEQFVIEALTRGAYGYLLKESAAFQIQSAIRSARASMFSVSPPTLLSSALGLVRQLGPPTTAPMLSERETQILQLVVQGLTNQEIAQRLHLAASSVKKYCLNASGKLGCKSRGAAAIAALRAGLIELPAEQVQEA